MTQPGPDQPADLYQVLGIAHDAARPDIVRACRQRARASHPDARPGDPAGDRPARDGVTSARQPLWLLPGWWDGWA